MRFNIKLYNPVTCWIVRGTLLTIKASTAKPATAATATQGEQVALADSFLQTLVCNFVISL